MVRASRDPQNEFKLFRAHVFVEIRHPSKFIEFSKSLMYFYHVFHSLAITHPFEFLEFSMSLTNLYHVFHSLAR
jgi:hypothetical protein